MAEKSLLTSRWFSFIGYFTGEAIMTMLMIFRSSSIFLLIILMVTSGCGWFVAQYDSTTVPYAGTQTNFYVVKDRWADGIAASPPMLSKITGATFSTAFFCLDTPITFVADTLTLPQQLYWYLSDAEVDHDLKYLRHKKEQETKAAEKQLQLRDK